MISIPFCRKDIFSSLIATSKKANVILLLAYKTFETTIEKSLKNSPVDQLSEINNNKAFFPENLKSKMRTKAIKKTGLIKT